MTSRTYFSKEFNLNWLMYSALILAFVACSSDDDAIVGENPDEDEVVPVEIADGELSEILQETLNVSSADDITEERMAQITTLNLSNSIVADLSGLETATNLEVLLARDVDIADLTPLSDLTNLKEIDMRNANMDSQTDLSFLANLNSLEKIDFQNTAVEDISVLSGKNTLLHISLRETNVTDISALENMVQLQFLNLNRAGGGNGIDNPEIIIPMENLYYLSLRNTEVGDDLMAQIFENKTQMVETNIRNTAITDIEFLVPIFEAGAFSVELSELYDNKRSLDLQNNAITNLCVIEDYIGLFDENNELEWSAGSGDFDTCDQEDPELGSHEFIEDEALLDLILKQLDLASFEDLTEESILDLVELNIRGTEVTSLAGLDKAINLEELDARDCEIDDISVLSSLDELRILNLRQTNVTDISPLEGKTQLQYLNLNRAGGDVGITNPEIVEPMVNLYYLSFRNSDLSTTDLSFFEEFTQLVEVNLRDTGITSIASLAVAFDKGAFTEELSNQYDNGLSLDLRGNDITDLCLISDYVDNFPDGDLEWSGSFSFEDCE